MRRGLRGESVGHSFDALEQQVAEWHQLGLLPLRRGAQYHWATSDESIGQRVQSCPADIKDCFGSLLSTSNNSFPAIHTKHAS